AVDTGDWEYRVVLVQVTQIVERQVEPPLHSSLDDESVVRIVRGFQDAGSGRRSVHGKALRARVGTSRRQERKLLERADGLADSQQYEQAARAEGGGEKRSPIRRGGRRLRSGGVRNRRGECTARRGPLRGDVHDERADRDPCDPVVRGSKAERPRVPEV